MTDVFDRPSELDILVYIASEADGLTEWERSFLTSTIRYLNDSKLGSLSSKQDACVIKMLRKYNINPRKDIVQGYADDTTVATAQKILNPPRPTAAPHYSPPPDRYESRESKPTGGYFDNMDDDIPF